MYLSCTCWCFCLRRLHETSVGASEPNSLSNTKRALVLSAETRAVRLPLGLHREHAACVLEKHPLISLHFLRVCWLQMCRGQRGAALPDPDVSRCRLQRMPAAQNLLGSCSRSSGQTHFHILWMFGKNKMRGGKLFSKGFFSKFHQQLRLSAVFAYARTGPAPKRLLCL